MPVPTSLVWLFDVDSTLLTTRGAAKQAFVLTVKERLGIDDPLDDIGFAGRTEPVILGDILRKHGLHLDPSEVQAFWNAVLRHMAVVYEPGRGTLLAGVTELLERVFAEPGWGAGLLTGNMTEMARIKLDRYGLYDRFAFGAFGEEARDRNELARIAVARAGERFGVTGQRCLVVGDSGFDIACARAAGAHVVAVATGGQSREELAALTPDLALDDLSDVDGLLDWARSLAADPSPRVR